MKHLVIGYRGQIGSALMRLLGEAFEVAGIDVDIDTEEEFDVLHVCIPYSEDFVKIVQSCQARYGGTDALTIIHSTVPIGTSDQCNAVHSPVRGRHPNLYEGLRAFVKYFGGNRSGIAAEIFNRLWIETKVVASARDTEALKLWDTTQYGLMIILEKEIHRFCTENDLDFETVYTEANQTYNKGYAALERDNLQRPFLVHQNGPIGGHCVIPNCALLDSPIARWIESKNIEF